MVLHTILMLEVHILSGSWDIAITGKRDGRTDGRTDGQPENMMPPAPPSVAEA